MKKKANFRRMGLIFLLVGLVISSVIYAVWSYIYAGSFRTILINGNFLFNTIGWRGSTGEIQTDQHGNKYIINDYNWRLYQIIDAKPGNSYSLSADTKRGTSNKAARLVVIFLNANGDKVSDHSIYYWHKSSDWETVPAQVINAPGKTEKMLIYLLTQGGNGYHCFDNIHLQKNKDNLPAAPSVVEINPPQRLQLLVNDEETASTEETQQVPLYEGSTIYYVEPGDTLNGIAMEFETELTEIIEANSIENPGNIYPGQKLVIPNGE